jgi:hypothetical protein
MMMYRADEEGAVFVFWESGRIGKGAILVRHADHVGTDVLFSARVFKKMLLSKRGRF